MAKTVNIHEAKTRLSALIKEVLEGGEVIIAKNNTPVVELKKIQPMRGKRVPGTLKDRLIVHGDFSEADREIEELFLNSNTDSDE